MADEAPDVTKHASAELMWEACRIEPDVDVVRAALSRGPDPAVLARAAADHGIAGLLWRVLVRARATDALGDYGRQIESLAELGRLEAMLLLPRALSFAVVPLTDAGLEPVVLKGPWLASRYPEPGLRSMVDIDLLLPKAQHDAAVRVLRKVGWEVVRPPALDRYDSVLTHSEVPKLAVELHFGFETRYKQLTAVDGEAYWSRRMAVDILGTPAFALPPAEELVSLAQHAGKPFHSFSRIIWIADLGVVVGSCVEVGKQVDWEAVHRLAVEGRCTTVVSAALAMARRVGVSAPEELFSPPRRGWQADAIACLFEETWPLHCDDDAAFHLRFALTDLPRRRLRLLVGSKYVMSEGPWPRWALDVPGETVSRCWRWLRSVQTTRGRAAKVGLPPLRATAGADH